MGGGILMFDFLKKITKDKYADVEDKVKDMLKNKGMKIKSIYWQDRFFFDDNMKHMHIAIIYVVDLKTKEITTNDVVEHGVSASAHVNHLNSGSVVYNDETEEIVLSLKKGDKDGCKSTVSTEIYRREVQD